MFRYAVGQLKSNKFIKIMAALVLSILVIVFSMSVYLNDAVFNFIAPRFYNPNAKIDVKVSATGGTNFIFEDVLDDYSQYIDKITPTMNLFGLCGGQDSSVLVSITGVNSKQVFFNEDYEIIEGTLVFQANQCVLPVSLAKNLGVRVGDSLSVECNKKTLNIAIVGIFKGFATSAAVDTMYVSDRTSSYFLFDSYSEGLYNTLNVQLNSTINAQDFIKILQDGENSNNINVVIAKDVNQLNTALSLANVPTTACMIMLIFLVLVIVFALYYLDSLKQHKLIAVFRDMGASTRQIFSVFLGSHFIVGLVGGAIGVAISCFVTWAISSLVGISVNVFAVAAIAFVLLIISNSAVSLASTAVSVKFRKSERQSKHKKSITNFILLGIVGICVIIFILLNVFTKRMLALGGVKDFMAIAAFAVLLVSVYAIIILVYDLYKYLHIKLLAKTSSIGLWLASASSLKGKQSKNFFIILTTIIVTLVTTSGLLFSVQNIQGKPISNQGDTVIFCGNVQDKSRDKLIKSFEEYDATVYWSAKEIMHFATNENVSTYVNILDKDIIDDLCVFNNPLSLQQLEYFASDTIGIYYSASRQSMLKEKVGAIKTVVTAQGNMDLPYLGYLKETSYAMTDVLINKATAAYLGIKCNIAYVRLRNVDIGSVLAATKSELFGNGIIAEKQSVLEYQARTQNKPMGDLFYIANNILCMLLFLALVFYVVLISNYQTDNFAKLKAVGMSQRALFASQVSLILPLCTLSAGLGIVLARAVQYCYNIIFNFLAVGTIRSLNDFVFYVLPAIAACVAAIVYLLSHYAVMKSHKSVRTDTER